MYETLEYIDAYFQQELDKEARAAFELRCVNDQAFAAEVAFYIAARGTAKEALLENKYKAWAGETTTAAAEETPVRKLPVRKWLSYAAAACLVIMIAAYFLFRNPTPDRLADNYINMTYTVLSHAMDASKDSLQLGMSAYNDKQYKLAIDIFDGMRQRDPANSEAQTYAGLAYYKTEDYDKALQCFEELATLKGEHNMGDFLKAATLLQRGQPRDKESARALLEKVDRESEDGSTTAKDILAKWK